MRLGETKAGKRRLLSEGTKGYLTQCGCSKRCPDKKTYRAESQKKILERVDVVVQDSRGKEVPGHGLLINNFDALPLSYRRLVGAKPGGGGGTPI